MPIPPKTLIIAAAITLLAGCAVLDKPQNATNAAVTAAAETPAEQLAEMHNPDKTDINWLFRYYRLVSTATGKLLVDEYEKTKKEFSEKRTATNQWQLAMLLSIPSTSFYDAEHSSDLFKELTNNDLEHDPHLNDAAFMMYTLINEQHRIDRKSDTIGAQFTESQAANKTLQDQLNALKALEPQLTELQNANKTLQDQLNALKAIENNLYQRNKAEVNPKP